MMKPIVVAIGVGLVFGAGVVGYQLGLRSEVESIDSVSFDSAKSREKSVLAIGSADSVTVSLEADRTSPRSVEEIFAKPWEERFLLFREYLDGMTAENVADYIEALQELPPGRKRTSMMERLFERWGKLEGSVAFEYAKSMEGRSRLRYLSSAAEGWADIEPDEAWEAIMWASNYGALSGISFRGALRSIARNDLQLAARLAMETEDRSSFAGRRVHPLIEAVEESGEYTKLVAMIERYSEGPTSGDYIENVFQRWGQYDYEGPSDAIRAMEDSELSKSAMTGLIQGWAESDGAGAFQYALENQSDPTFAEAIPSIVRTWVRSATAEEIRSIPERLEGLEDYDENMRRVVSSFAKADPKMAFDLASSLADENLRTKSIGSVMFTWSLSEIDKARSFLPEIPDAKARSSAARSMIYSHVRAKSSPEEIVSLVEHGSDQKEKERLLSSIARQAQRHRTSEHSRKLVEYLKTELPKREDVSDDFRNKLLKELD